MQDNQFYPTPIGLAIRAKSLFKNKKIVRMLEPSAGRGDLLEPFVDRYEKFTVDCIEIDLSNQAILLGKGYNVVDADFLEFDGAPLYSHILLNPPFAQGDSHLLKAWDLLVNGEIVAILNAETIKNPYSEKRKFLVSLVEQHGTVEFVQQAFMDPDTFKKTDVEIALIWMEKKADIRQNFTQILAKDHDSGVDYAGKQELALKNSTISNSVLVFNAAVGALRVAEVASKEARYYANLLGKPLNHHISEEEIKLEDLQSRFNKGYDDLKNRA